MCAVGSDHRTVRITVELAIQQSNRFCSKRWKTTKEKLASFQQCIATCDLTQPMIVEEMNINIVQKINKCARRVIEETSGKPRIGRKKLFGGTVEQRLSKGCSRKTKGKKSAGKITNFRKCSNL